MPFPIHFTPFVTGLMDVRVPPEFIHILQFSSNRLLPSVSLPWIVWIVNILKMFFLLFVAPKGDGAQKIDPRIKWRAREEWSNGENEKRKFDQVQKGDSEKGWGWNKLLDEATLLLLFFLSSNALLVQW